MKKKEKYLVTSIPISEEILEQRYDDLNKRLYNITMYYKNNGLSLDDCKKALQKEIAKEKEWLKNIEENSYIVEE